MRSAGIPEDRLDATLNTLNGAPPALEQAEVPEYIRSLLLSLHSDAWFDVGTQRVITRRGGRQGCKHGPVLFELGYELALRNIRARLAEIGVQIKVRTFSGHFWSREQKGGQDRKHPVETTFVDDAVIVALTKTPFQMWQLVPRIVEIVATCFAEYGMKINLSKGKTEGFLQFRGKRQADFKRRLAAQQHAIPVPGLSAPLRIVEEYIHLGSTLSSCMLPACDLERRISAASAAYRNCVHLLGAACMHMRSRLQLAASLVLSRLFFNIHVWSVLPSVCLQRINTMYMRVLRRCMGQVRFKGGGLTDLQVRVAIGKPSVECVISRNRLVYFSQLLRSPASQLRSLLSFRGGSGERLPWVSLLIGDLESLRAAFPNRLSELGSPEQCPEAWADFVSKYPRQWKEIVCDWVSSESVCDSRKHPPDCLPALHICGQCQHSFESVRALRTHQRFAHKQRSSRKAYAGEDGKCQICSVVFSTRLRLIAHLTDTRRRGQRSPCGLQLHLCDPLSPAEVERLDLLDTESRRKARRAGLTQPRSQGMVINKRSRNRASDVVPPSPKRYRVSQKAPECSLFKRRRMN